MSSWLQAASCNYDKTKKYADMNSSKSYSKWISVLFQSS